MLQRQFGPITSSRLAMTKAQSSQFQVVTYDLREVFAWMIGRTILNRIPIYIYIDIPIMPDQIKLMRRHRGSIATGGSGGLII